jgi:hypothetical protein
MENDTILMNSPQNWASLTYLAAEVRVHAYVLETSHTRPCEHIAYGRDSNPFVFCIPPKTAVLPF